MHWAQIWKCLTLIVVANGTPVIVRRISGGKCAQAIDFGYTLRDARSIFGPSKTVRGLLCSIAASVSTAPVLGLDWLVGLLAGASAMAGDLFSSFVKRRMGFRPSERATGLDQIPESLIPATACANALGLNWLDVLVITGAFFAVSILLSRILYGLSIRRRPY